MQNVINSHIMQNQQLFNYKSTIHVVLDEWDKTEQEILCDLTSKLYFPIKVIRDRKDSFLQELNIDSVKENIRFVVICVVLNQSFKA